MNNAAVVAVVVDDVVVVGGVDIEIEKFVAVNCHEELRTTSHFHQHWRYSLLMGDNYFRAGVGKEDDCYCNCCCCG